ncbi:response regulators consisting of a CheY-like receiver domain and a winged-helix DNA-binding domain [Longilinea arvoryzae]|uniref:Response regulators consisting of a CheY-like receiver domain and a winged-helix DNA-binding domain n=1 Tax=Longilinea arvoryzae TaxID=360412 RepID=A0A0S7BLT9_9CHLR|nr:response regulator transcription factor [Longilinea arvoryzae]GAP14913.1 response regulators consisting of a CheY-like receiver domain and a winged-helix DNA-binding domain [Longilinea arvoryzae]
MAENIRVLVVDDEQIARLTLQRIVQVGKYDVVTVGSGEEAIAALNAEHFDVMLLDLNMPGMSGLDVLADPIAASPDLKVIVLTAYGSMETAIQALRFHVHDYLVKPISKEQVLTSIAQALESRTLLESRMSEAKPSLTETTRRAIYQIDNGVVIDCDRRVVSWSTLYIHLTPTEAKLMHAFLDSPGIVLNPSDLVSFSHGFRSDQLEAARILRPVFSRLRSKLIPIPGAQDWIRNVRGAGYVFEAPVTKV